MALDMKQSLKLTQQLVMTPQLQQAIKLLQLSRLELVEAVQQELLENPVLEEVQEGEMPEDEISGVDALAEDFNSNTNDNGDGPVTDIDWETFLDNYFSYDSDYYAKQDEEEANFESFISTKTTLAEHLIWQLRLSNFTREEEQVGISIIGNLDDDGYLRASLQEIAQDTKMSEEFVAQVLAKVQKFDPVGIAARDLRECLLIQVNHWNLQNSIIEKIISEHFNLLEKRDIKGLSRVLKVSQEEVQHALKIIAGMEPKPGRALSDERVQYITPDIFIHKVGDEYVVVLNEDGLPKLKISPYYRSLLRRDGNSSELARGYVKEKLRCAMWLIKSIHQRQRTIYRVTKSIVKFQREFFEKGISALKPLVLKDVANDIGMHESTVSRVTTNKFAHTPQGIFELKFFLSSGIGTTEGGSIAAESVKQKILQLISNEDPLNPLSDQQIAEVLRGMDIDIARRTVTKYREAMNILSSSKRKKCY
mgnify:CR=1 FL=1